MQFGFLQFDVNHDVEKNINKIKTMLQQITADIIILPELCSCGYLFDDEKSLSNFAEQVPTGLFCLEMMKLSKCHNCALIFGIAEKDNNKIYNTADIMENGNYIGKYRKIHLSNYEKKLFIKGDCNRVFNVKGIKIGVQICFDIWFPEISREQVLKGAEILCILANFGGETSYDISRIRAIENLTPVILCNRIGFEKSTQMDATFLGKSTVIKHNGDRVVIGKKNIETVDSCNLLVNPKSNAICDDFMKEINFHYKK